jgi:hypothetical protein
MLPIKFLTSRPVAFLACPFSTTGNTVVSVTVEIELKELNKLLMNDGPNVTYSAI